MQHAVSNVQVVAEARKALEWLEEKQRLQGSLRKTDDPVLSSADIKKREDTIVRFADPILSKPAPPPPKVRRIPTLECPQPPDWIHSTSMSLDT